MKKITVLSVVKDHGGVGFFRCEQPHVNMVEEDSNEFFVTIKTIQELCKDLLTLEKTLLQYNIVHFNEALFFSRTVEEEIELIKKYQAQGVKFVCDMDDYWEIGNFHHLYNVIDTKMRTRRCLEIFKVVDGITTTTQIYANKLKKYNKNVIVIPNTANKNSKQFQPIKFSPTKRLRLGVICGASHEHDLINLKGLANQLQTAGLIDKIQFVLCGFDTRGNVKERNVHTGEIKTRPIKPEETVWKRYEEVLTDNYKIVSPEYKEMLLKYSQSTEHFNDKIDEPYMRWWTRPVSDYCTHYENIDVLLVPLKEVEFNKCKSQLKVIEAGFKNKAIIAQDFGPYTIDLRSALKKGGEIDMTGNSITVDCKHNHKGWFKAIKALINNPELLKNITNNLHKEITEKYEINVDTKIREEFYKQLIKN